MSSGQHIIYTLARLLSSRLLYRAFFGLCVILISNYLIIDAALLDDFEIASSMVNIIMITSEVGMSMVVMRVGSQANNHELQRTYGTALLIEGLASIGLSVVVLGGIALMNGVTQLFWLIVLLGIGQAAVQFRVIFRAIYRTLGKSEWITFVEVLDGMVKLVGIYLISTSVDNVTQGVYYIAGWLTLTTVVFVGMYGLPTLFYVRPKIELALTPKLVKEGVWFTAQALVMTLYFELDKLMLRWFDTQGWVDLADGDIGRYAAAARLVVFLLLFHRIILQVLTPYLYKHSVSNLEKYRQIIRLATKYLAAAGIAMGFGLTALAEPIIQLLYAKPLWSAVPALQLFGIFLSVRFFGVISSQILATTHHQPLRTRIELLGVGINVLANCITIPLYGFVGGAISTLITECITQAILYYHSRKVIHMSYWQSISDALPAVAAGLLMWVVAFYGYTLTGWLTVGIASGAITYIALLVGTGFISQADRRLIQ